MVQIFINCLGKTDLIDLNINSFGDGNQQLPFLETILKSQIVSYYSSHNIDQVFDNHFVDDNFYLTTQGGQPFNSCREYDTININFKICGGIDFQHREGSKVGSGGVSSEAQAAIERRERLRKLALETIDITKDPYIMKNHLGSYECKLCLTLHPNEGNYLAHTQGKRHQSNLGRRASMEAKNAAPKPLQTKDVVKKRVLKIGRPGYKVTKSRDLHTQQRSLTFEIDYPEVADDMQPRHRFMSAYEQKVDTPADKNFQYLLFACDPYETIGFKIPNQAIDKSEGRFFTNWDQKGKKFVLQLFFIESHSGAASSMSGAVAVQ